MKNERKRLSCFGLVFTACLVLGRLLALENVCVKSVHLNLLVSGCYAYI